MLASPGSSHVSSTRSWATSPVRPVGLLGGSRDGDWPEAGEARGEVSAAIANSAATRTARETGRRCTTGRARRGAAVANGRISELPTSASNGRPIDLVSGARLRGDLGVVVFSPTSCHLCVTQPRRPHGSYTGCSRRIRPPGSKPMCTCLRCRSAKQYDSTSRASSIGPKQRRAPVPAVPRPARQQTSSEQHGNGIRGANGLAGC